MAIAPLVAIVEDDDTLRSAISGLLRSWGYRTIEHGSAEDFLTSDAMREADCIITDIQMPGMDGIALKQRIDEHRPGLPVIMITARVEEHLLARAFASKPLSLLRKPFEPDALVEWVRQALAKPG